MKEINCDVIRDLLPGYIDKISSESTNKLVSEHLQNCKSCSKLLVDMNKDIDEKLLFNQNEQIDYLKGFRKDKIKSIIKAILIFIIILLVLFLFIQQVMSRFEFFVDINSLYVSYSTKEVLDDDSIELQFNALDSKFNLHFNYDESDEKYIYVEPVGDFPYSLSPSRTIFSVTVNKNTEKIFLRDKKGNMREIWNKDNGILLEDKIYMKN